MKSNSFIAADVDAKARQDKRRERKKVEEAIPFNQKRIVLILDWRLLLFSVEKSLENGEMRGRERESSVDSPTLDGATAAAALLLMMCSLDSHCCLRFGFFSTINSNEDTVA